uniref:Phosphoinositide 3-kinase regulatory subunit 5 n=1 Tax=Xenopus laevis TaxID=8355 RepID=PI3R5_XENLA|nr:RecName: Full=Phosphoinositide 3-kinase regulatory subunit 5; Short=PI3-kinase regulatory subunit 5 [Xenopus laevis]
MQNTSCTEDRIQHALERCLHGLSGSTDISSNWTAGLCLNYWSLEELVNRDATNYIILAEKTLARTREAQKNGEYELLTPLALMFYFAVLRAPYIPETSDLLPKAFEVFHTFLTWPAPYCHVYQEMLSFISEEQKAPGITYQRLVRTEQGIPTRSSCSSTATVLLVNPAELPSEFLSVAEQLSNAEQPIQQTLVSLIQHLFQASLGTHAHTEELGASLKSRPIEKLQEIYSDLTEAMEHATMADIKPGKKRESLKAKLLEVAEKAGLMQGNTGSSLTSRIQPIFMPVAKCYTYSWDQDDFDILNQILLSESHLESLEDDVTEEDEEVDFEEVDDKDEDGGKSPKQDSVFSNSYVYWNFPSDSKEDPSMSMSNLASHSMTFVSSLSSCVDSGYVEDSDEGSQEISEIGEYQEERANNKLKQKICQLFKTKGHQAKDKLKAELSPCISHPLLSPFPDISKTIPLRRAGSMYTPQLSRIPVRSKRSKSLPQPAFGTQFLDLQLSQKVAFKRRPFLSCDDDTKVSTLRIVVFGSDRISGKVARAYSNLRLKESSCPLLTRFFKLQFYYIPVKRSSSSTNAPMTNAESPLKSPSPSGRFPLQDVFGDEASTNDISHYIGILDPWYKRNIMGLMDLSTSMLCQSSKEENETTETTTMPILADMVLYYCRFATRSLLLQLYRAEITFDSGGKQTEVFIQCLELGHSADLRAIRASGPGCKRLGIDGDQDVIPFTLQIVYSKSTVSGRSRWSNGEKVCTSVSLRKACNTYEELDSKMECLNLTVREVVKRQNSKTKKSFNQICTSHIKIDKAQIIAQHGGTFPLCLDQDERKILQRVIKCEVSPCYKPEDRDFCRRNRRPSWSQASQNQSEFCSLLCLPIATFCGAQP